MSISVALPGGISFKSMTSGSLPTNTWVYFTYLGTPRYGAGGFVYQGKLYIAGGRNGGKAIKTLEIIDLTTAKRSYGSDMPVYRSHFGFVFDESKPAFYVVGGVDESSWPRPEIYSYNPITNEWKAETAKLPKGIGYTQAVLVGGYIYVVGGVDDQGNILKDTYKVDISGGTVSQVASMNKGRENHACAELGGMIYCFGGDDGGTILQSVEMYNPSTNTWTNLGDILPEALTGLTAVKHGDKILILGG